MMIFDQSFRISAFGNFEDIRPTTDNMQYVLEEFSKKGFLPSIFQEMIIPGNNGQLSQQQRIALVSGDGRKQVSISSNRLDYDVKFSDEYSLVGLSLEGYDVHLTILCKPVLENGNKVKEKVSNASLLPFQIESNSAVSSSTCPSGSVQLLKILTFS